MNNHQSPVRSITVTGDADIRVVPDEVVLSLGVETLDKNLPTAKKQNDESVQKVLALTQKHGIDSKHIQTDYLSVEPVYRTYQDKHEFIGFQVRKTIVVTLKDIAKFESVLTQALEGGATHVHGIEFQTTELKRHRNEARSLAIKAAQAKAKALANELNQSLGEPLRIQEERSGWRAWNVAWWGQHGMREYGLYSQNARDEGDMSSLETTIAPGQIVITARVTVEFALA